MKKLVVDQKKCVGCGTCFLVAEKVFELGKDGKSQVASQTAGSQREIDEAIESCPVAAISYKNR